MQRHISVALCVLASIWAQPVQAQFKVGSSSEADEATNEFSHARAAAALKRDLDTCEALGQGDYVCSGLMLQLAVQLRYLDDLAGATKYAERALAATVAKGINYTIHLTRFLSETLILQGRYAEAEQIVRSELDRVPDRVGAGRARLLGRLGSAILAQGRDEEAASYLEKAIEESSSCSPTQTQLACIEYAKILQKRGRYGEVVILLSRAESRLAPGQLTGRYEIQYGIAQALLHDKSRFRELRLYLTKLDEFYAQQIRQPWISETVSDWIKSQAKPFHLMRVKASWISAHQNK